MQKAPVEFNTGLRMFGLKPAKTRAQGAVAARRENAAKAEI
jgi:hypothetical protein